MDVIEKHSFLSLAENFIQNKHKGIHMHAHKKKRQHPVQSEPGKNTNMLQFYMTVHNIRGNKY